MQYFQIDHIIVEDDMIWVICVLADLLRVFNTDNDGAKLPATYNALTFKIANNFSAGDNMITLAAINIAKTEEIQTGKNVVSTGIFKRPQTKPVKLGALGFEGDSIVDLKVHGGEDQAVYIYLMEDYRWWEQTLERELSPGFFGENLTFDGISHQDLKVGDRFKLGEVELELSGPRIPCSKLSARMETPSFIKQFFHANRPGAYARVITPGLLDKNCSVQHQATPEDTPKIDHLFQAWHTKPHDRQFLEQALASPLGQYHRKKIEQWLAK